MRSAVHQGLLALRQTRLRRPIISGFVRLHNFSYHMISLFASHSGTHPKHDIVKYYQFFLDNIQADDSVLDIGCGKGEVAHAVALSARKVVGIDFSPESISLAKKKGDKENLSFIVGDATTYAFTEPVDVIILSNVLEHIKERVTFLKKLKVIAPKILIRVPMITRDWIAVYKKNEGFEYRLDDTHYLEYDVPTFMAEMKAAGLNVVSHYVNFGELYAVTERLET